MARKVKCAVCKKEGTNETFFKVQIDKSGKKFRYYCEEAEYRKVQHEQKMKEEQKAQRIEEQKAKIVHDEVEKEEYKDLISFVIDDILEYDKHMIFPTAMVKRIRKLRENFEYKIIKEAFSQNKDSIRWAIANKDFKTEYNMVAYTMAIVEGTINDVYKKFKEAERLQAQLDANPHDWSAQFALDDLNEGKQIDKTKHKKKSGIGSFLEDDDI